MFPIIELPDDAYDLAEQMGTKFKFWHDRPIVHFWYDDPIRTRMLFKEGRPNTGENWAEKLACELAALLCLPHAYYDLARWKNTLGVLSPIFLPVSGRFIHGNEIVGGKVAADYNDERIRRYRETGHTSRGDAP